ncbi:MAG TPA: hypothetical protein PKV23_04925, partial [Aestuariivirga sp.]|nr:hypothetical protein [Aestuariivirga sp.]
GRYKVIDPTFRGHVWMDRETIDAEASGIFLVPKAKAPEPWAKVSPELFRVIATVMPVAFWNSLTMLWHHSSCTEQ